MALKFSVVNPEFQKAPFPILVTFFEMVNEDGNPVQS